MRRLLLVAAVVLIGGCGSEIGPAVERGTPSATSTPFEPAPPADGGTQQGHR